MKKYIILTLAACALLSSCEEFGPVFTFDYKDPANYEDVSGSNVVQPGDITPTHTIAELVSLYTPGSPIQIEDDVIIAGRIISSDKRGNFYKQVFIQDETGGIEVKIGKNSLYNEYKPGQMLYVKVGPGEKTLGLTLGSYGYKSGSGNGMPQIGSKFHSGEYATSYESSYIMSDRVINDHIFRGSYDDIEEQTPVVIDASQFPSANGTLANCPYIGRLVTIKNLSYGGLKIGNYDVAGPQIFALLYLSSESSSKESQNRVFLSKSTWGVDTWAMSKVNFLSHLRNGDFDEAVVGNSGDQEYGSVSNVNIEHLKSTDPVFYENIYADEAFRRTVYWWVYGVYPENEEDQELAAQRMEPDNLVKYWVRYRLATNANGYAVSHYFNVGGKNVQLRTSGFAKFADEKIPQEVLDGTKKVSITGVLTMYQGSVQLVVNDLDDIVVE
ncbi:MAG: DUF5689 domain-containing protein [Candidatus Cryptobacteroides sp.]